ncbi:TRAP transporter small permease subunit [Sedimenticola sp.]|uniref:TRAP transporter small permease subunit n=1 Tax=Sedimenticola sp. TaxID=1940285 RepID=UPI003D0E309B
MFLLQLENAINSFADLLGKVAGVLLIALLFNVFFDVIMRYLFNDVSIGMQELEWHLYASVFMLGISYALRHNGHVRVDLVYERQSVKTKAWIDLLGTLLFLLPFSLLVCFYGIDFVRESFQMSEQSGDPGGLPFRWLIKSMIPFAFLSMTISGIGMALHSVNTLLGRHQDLNTESFY